MGHALFLMLAGSLACLVACGVLIRWADPLRLMDRPTVDRKIHTHPMPRTGGLALWLVIIAVQATGTLNGHLDAMDWAGVHLMALVGLLDDRFDLRARQKALAGFAVAVMLAVHAATTLGLGASHVLFLDLEWPTHPAVIVPILTLWFWSVPQAYNLMDGINGLSLGFGALLLAVLGWNLGLQSPLLWGGLATVLLLNYPKAHHFLGDCGALMLGTLFAILAVEAFAFKNANLLLWVFAYPAMDVAMVVAIRKWKGQPLGVADKSHLHHWMLERLDGRAWLATPILLGVAVLPMLRATALPGHRWASLLGLGLLLVLAVKNFKDRVTQTPVEASPEQVARVVPLVTQKAFQEASGSHPRL